MRNQRLTIRFLAPLLLVLAGCLSGSALYGQDENAPDKVRRPSRGDMSETVEQPEIEKPEEPTQVPVDPAQEAPVEPQSEDPLPAGFRQKTPKSQRERSRAGDLNWIDDVAVGYDGGFQFISNKELHLDSATSPFRLQINGWGQVRHSSLDSRGSNQDVNQFQLKRARLIFSGNAFTSDFSYFIQLDGRSSSGDTFRLLDYSLALDFGHHSLGMEKGKLGFRAGKYKMPVTMARAFSGKQFEFTDRSMASTFFDVNRSLSWGLYGRSERFRTPVFWELALFNGLVTGGAETGSSGTLDNNFAYSGRVYWYPRGDWGDSEIADFEGHCQLATRFGAGWANSSIDRIGSTEFDTVLVVDSGLRLSSLLPVAVDEYTVNIFAVDWGAKFRGWSFTSEYYFRSIGGYQGAQVPDLFDHGFWLQMGKFVVPKKVELLSRWSRVVGNSGTVGVNDQSADEISGGIACYFGE